MVNEHWQIPPGADLFDVDLIRPSPLYHAKEQVLPIDGANYRVTVCSLSPEELDYEPNEPNTINL